MNGIALSAPFFEWVGYGLAIAAFAILAAGVMWRLTQSITPSYRFLFRILLGSLIVKVAVAIFFLMRFTLLTDRPTVPSYSRPFSNQGASTPASQGKSKTFELALTPEGNLHWEGEPCSLENFEARLTLLPPETRFSIHPHALTPWDKVIQITDALHRNGIHSISFDTDASAKESVSGEAAESLKYRTQNGR